MDRLYNDYNTHLRTTFGCRVYRIGLDAGFSCPNRDGTKGEEGCIYCNERAARAGYTDPAIPLAGQIAERIAYLKTHYGARKYIAYFQASTNTYAPVDLLKKTYDTILPFDDIVGLSIGTRPDTIDEKKAALIASYRNRYDVWLEYGLQSIHDATLTALGRGHTFADFTTALGVARHYGIPVAAHIIIGLPGETPDDMRATAHALAMLRIDGIKIHLLHVLKGSGLEALYAAGKVPLLTQDAYAAIVADLLELLPPETVIMRLTGEGVPGEHIAPAWAQDKLGTIRCIREEMKRRKSVQGSRYTDNR